MKKYQLLMGIGIVCLSMLCGCQEVKAEKNGGETVIQNKMNEDEDVKYMMETYGFTSEELEGVDVIRFVKDYGIKGSSLTSQEVREILDEVRSEYVDDGTSKLYKIFDAQPGGKLKKEDQIKKVAFVYNPGTFKQSIIFDLENNVRYVDNATPHTLTAEQKAVITDLAKECDIYSWDNEYRGKERDSTGSLYWKLVFQLADDSLCVYSGYTQDGSHLPPTYSDVLKAVTSIVK